ncbi:hypothetical protein [Maribellus sediminis]|uniref:hypothetical protein n=1 Tax=Maribellus sediminis TaxID=2696285 RepID=UPI00143110C6|nr:hypothetical protein [Maribellus sediminis]
MIIKTIIVSVVLVAIVMLALGIKMLFDKNAKFEMRSCSFVNEENEKEGTHPTRKIEVKKLSVNDLTKKET